MNKTYCFSELTNALRALSANKGLCIAFSGGLDSRFLAYTALRAGVDVLAVHIAGAHIPKKETAWAVDWAARAGIPCTVIRADVLSLAGVHDNSRERCYYCKRHIFSSVREHAGSRILCDGSNADDRGHYRPGLRALREAGVVSPLADLGLSKADIRILAVDAGLEQAQQSARPCLLTRLAYGMTPDEATLACIEAAEDALTALGLTDFRLRLTPAPVLQTLPLTPPLRDAVKRVLIEYGYTEVGLLEETRISGYFDR